MIRTLSCKPTVRVTGFTPASIRILEVLIDLCHEDPAPWPSDLVITSMNDSTHAKDSRHYKNEAVDLRTHNVRREYRHLLREHLQQKLGPAFTVLLEYEGGENEHLHIQPVKGTVYPPPISRTTTPVPGDLA